MPRCLEALVFVERNLCAGRASGGDTLPEEISHFLGGVFSASRRGSVDLNSIAGRYDHTFFYPGGSRDPTENIRDRRLRHSETLPQFYRGELVIDADADERHIR